MKKQGEEVDTGIQRDQELALRVSQLIQLREEQSELLNAIKHLSPYLNKPGKLILEELIQKKEALVHSFNQLEDELYQLSFSVFQKINQPIDECSKTERLICIYLMLNYSPCEIALMTGKNTNSISVAITRIKSKLKVEEFDWLKSSKRGAC